MKAIVIATLMCSTLFLSATPPAAADPLNALTPNCNAIIDVQGGIVEDVCGNRNPCVDTAANCGPYGNAWAYAEVDLYYVRVCVTSNTANLLC